MKKPETGGRFERDPKTRRLKQVETPTQESADAVPVRLLSAETETAKADQARVLKNEGN